MIPPVGVAVALETCPEGTFCFGGLLLVAAVEPEAVVPDGVLLPVLLYEPVLVVVPDGLLVGIGALLVPG